MIPDGLGPSRVISDLSNPVHASLWAEWARLFRSLPAAPMLQLSDIQKIDGCPSGIHEYTKGVLRRDGLPAEIAKAITASKIDAIVLDHILRNVATTEADEYEIYAAHARAGDEHYMLDIARLDVDVSPGARAKAVLENAFNLMAKRIVPPKTPILGAQPASSIRPVRMALATAGVAYALRVDDDAWFSNVVLPPDAADDIFDDYHAEQAFRIIAKARKGRPLPPVLTTETLTMPGTERRIVEYLVVTRGPLFFVVRPDMPLQARVKPEHWKVVIALAEQAARLPSVPLLHDYRAHELHHRNYGPMENLLMACAHALAMMLGGHPPPMADIEAENPMGRNPG